jgi:hypothetical protein
MSGIFTAYSIPSVVHGLYLKVGVSLSQIHFMMS